MRNIIFLSIVLLLSGCGKEDDLKPELEFENLYAITDDPSDAVRHRVYELYEQYGVPVYFNDTISKIFVKEDIYGNPVYRYETLDLAWGFTSHSGLTYKYEYMYSTAEKLEALDIVEDYLKLANKALYPYNFFIVKSATTKDRQGNIEEYSDGAYVINTRSLLITGNWDETLAEELPGNMRKDMVKNKINNYSDLLSDFNKVSKNEWYDTEWEYLDPGFRSDVLVSPNDFGYLYDDVPPTYYFSSSCLEDDWWGTEEFTPEGLENFRAAYRSKIGQFGFVGVGFASMYTPESTEDDLEEYISEMLRWSKEVFYELWGNCPLVMRKYDILYGIVADKLGVEL